MHYEEIFTHYNMVVFEHKLWYVMRRNLLCTIDLVNSNFKYIASIPVGNNVKNYYRCILHKGNQLTILLNEHDQFTYDILQGTFRRNTSLVDNEEIFFAMERENKKIADAISDIIEKEDRYWWVKDTNGLYYTIDPCNNEIVSVDTNRRIAEKFPIVVPFGWNKNIKEIDETLIASEPNTEHRYGYTLNRFLELICE